MDTTLADLLRVGRALRRLSQREVARLASITPSRYWALENGYVAARPDELQRLAVVLDFGVLHEVVGEIAAAREATR